MSPLSDVKVGAKVSFRHGMGRLQGVVVELRTHETYTQAVIHVPAIVKGESGGRASPARDYVRNVHFVRVLE